MPPDTLPCNGCGAMRNEADELRAALYHLCGWVRDHARATNADRYPQQLIDAEDVLDRHALALLADNEGAKSDAP